MEFKITELRPRGLQGYIIETILRLRDRHGGPADAAGYIKFYFGSPHGLSDFLRRQGMEGLSLSSYVLGFKTRVGYLDLLESRRPGLGTVLMNMALALLEERGVRDVFAHVDIRADGRPVPGLFMFYSKFGFSRIDCCQDDELPVIWRRL